MKRLACGSVVQDCTAVLEAETEDELLRAVARHAQEAHGMGEIPPSVVDQVRANIQDV
jgi:predicted small metal-binding protein